jgi:predicted transport protein
MTLDEFFAGQDVSRQIFEVLRRTIDNLGPAELRISKSQIAFRRRKAFAWVWIPGKYLKGKVAPLVLTLSFNRQDTSSRWKEIVEPAPGRFTHHLELYSIKEIDAEVHRWLVDAWEFAS